MYVHRCLFFIFISSWFYITILCRIRFIRLPFFPFIFFFTNGRIDCPLPFLSNFSRVSEIHNYDLVRVFFFSFLSFFFFLIRFQKTISTRDKKKKRKEKQATCIACSVKEWCIDWFHLWFNFVYIYFTYISKVATKVWTINLWKCHSVNIKSKALLPFGRNRCFSTSSRILVFSPQYKK